MFIERKLREELSALSKDVFRVSSKWQSILESGFNELVTEEIDETIPGENGEPDKVEKVKVPVLKNGVKQYVHRTYTLDEVHKMMLDMKKQIDGIRAKMAAAQAQKELEKKVNDEAQGRVVG